MQTVCGEPECFCYFEVYFSDCSSQHLLYIPEFTYQEVSLIKVVDFRHNNIQYINETDFSKWSSLYELNIKDNSNLNCSSLENIPADVIIISDCEIVATTPDVLINDTTYSPPLTTITSPPYTDVQTTSYSTTDAPGGGTSTAVTTYTEYKSSTTFVAPTKSEVQYIHVITGISVFCGLQTFLFCIWLTFKFRQWRDRRLNERLNRRNRHHSSFFSRSLVAQPTMRRE